ncbi:hypothetical protein FRB94_007072 [Tulasnella sp. JGI-2019a]|nr:hypothetical protein FRB94_007072 [Tulasnella sp. JGI-2019a]KAG9016983.1 hypothetical protein FRB93_009513 [Tulasnella sp. JGI-2019a]
MLPSASRLETALTARIIPILLAAACIPYVAAQATVATCNSNATWWNPLNNAAHQDPCTVASLVQVDLCGPQSTLSRNTILTPNVPSCLCYKVVYDLFGACSACGLSTPSDASYQSYNSWSTNCKVTNAIFNDTGANTAVVPAWLWSYTAQDFNVTAALGIAKDLNSSALNHASASPNVPVPIATSTISDSTQPSTAAPTTGALSESKKSSNVGPVVGGVIGGIILLALAAFLILRCLQWKRRKQVAPSSEFTKYIQQPTLARPPTRQEPKYSSAGPVGATQFHDGPEPSASTDQLNMEELPGFTPGHYAGPVFEKGGYMANPNSPSYSSPLTNGSSSHQLV